MNIEHSYYFVRGSITLLQLFYSLRGLDSTKKKSVLNVLNPNQNNWRPDVQWYFYLQLFYDSCRSLLAIALVLIKQDVGTTAPYIVGFNLSSFVHAYITTLIPHLPPTSYLAHFEQLLHEICFLWKRNAKNNLLTVINCFVTFYVDDKTCFLIFLFAHKEL